MTRLLQERLYILAQQGSTYALLRLCWDIWSSALPHQAHCFSSWIVTLSRPRLIQSLHQALNAAGVDCSGFSGHSFHIGAATTAVEMGLSNTFTQTLGRWKSAVFTLYI